MLKPLLTFFAIILSGAVVPLAAETLRPPAVPLVACDPYFSIWSQGDKLTDADTTHWTGKPHRLTSLVRIDGNPFCVMGKDSVDVPALSQTDVEVLPTRTIYTFAGGGIKLTLTFMTPMLPDDLDVLSRPVTYLTWTAAATDRQTHKVEIYFDASGEIAINTGKQQVSHSQRQIGKLAVLEIGSVEQPVLEKSGDDLRIDWGHFYLALPKSAGGTELISPRQAFRSAFVTSGVSVPPDIITPASADADSLVAAATFALGEVGGRPVSRWLILVYDDEYSIQYMHKNLRPYWRRNGDDAAALLK